MSDDRGKVIDTAANMYVVFTDKMGITDAKPFHELSEAAKDAWYAAALWAYNDGYEDGKTDATDHSYDEGYDDGYNAGYVDGEENAKEE